MVKILKCGKRKRKIETCNRLSNQNRKYYSHLRFHCYHLLICLYMRSCASYLDNENYEFDDELLTFNVE